VKSGVVDLLSAFRKSKQDCSGSFMLIVGGVLARGT
jgi:hypothetical protein